MRTLGSLLSTSLAVSFPALAIIGCAPGEEDVEVETTSSELRQTTISGECFSRPMDPNRGANLPPDEHWSATMRVRISYATGRPLVRAYRPRFGADIATTPLDESTFVAPFYTEPRRGGQDPGEDGFIDFVPDTPTVLHPAATDAWLVRYTYTYFPTGGGGVAFELQQEQWSEYHPWGDGNYFPTNRVVRTFWCTFTGVLPGGNLPAR